MRSDREPIDCEGNVVEDVEVELSPAPERLIYSSTGSLVPSRLARRTNLPYGVAWGLNLPPGPVEVRATRAG